MHFNEKIDFEIFKKSAFIRAFEEEIYKNIENKNIKIPVYLSAGQEYISSTFATFGGRPLFDTFVNKELTSAPQFGQTMGNFPKSKNKVLH